MMFHILSMRLLFGFGVFVFIFCFFQEFGVFVGWGGVKIFRFFREYRRAISPFLQKEIFLLAFANILLQPSIYNRFSLRLPYKPYESQVSRQPQT